jgi:carbamoyl-phosphate synthase large subunit
VDKVSEGTPNVADFIREGGVDLVVNTPFGRGPRTDGYFIRTAAALAGIPCITTLPGVMAALRGIEALRGKRSRPRSIQEYHELARTAAPLQESIDLVTESAAFRSAGEEGLSSGATPRPPQPQYRTGR